MANKKKMLPQDDEILLSHKYRKTTENKYTTVHNYTSTQLYKYTSTQKYITIQEHNYTSVQKIVIFPRIGIGKDLLSKLMYK